MNELLERPTPAVVQAANETLPLMKEDEEHIYLVAGGRKIPLNPFFVKLFMQIFEQVRLGKPISVLPHNAEMTTQQAAALLNVSRPFVSKLIKNGELAYEMRGTHRRIRLEEVMRYKQERAVRRRKAISVIAELSDECGFPD